MSAEEGTQSIPKSVEKSSASFIFARSLDDFDRKLNDVKVERDEVKEWLAQHPADVNESIKSMGQSWYGLPVPKSYDDAMARDKFLRMDDYRNIRETVIKPLITELMMPSLAQVTMEKMRYNDLAIGTFDFSKAAVNLLPKYKYYSVRHKKVVEFADVLTKVEGDKSKYYLKSDGSEAIIVPVYFDNSPPERVAEAYEKIKNGADPYLIGRDMGLQTKYYSTIKKSYLWKEKVPKPKNAIRLFALIGGNAGVSGEELMYTGITTLAIAELLEMNGYSINVNCCIGMRYSGWNNGKGVFSVGSRFAGFEQKKFSDTIDSQSMLYVLADPTFFRVKVFRYLMLMQERYQDAYDDSLGQQPSNETFKNAVYATYGVRDGLFNLKKGRMVRNENSPFLYYFVGSVHSMEGIAQAVREIILSAENENRIAREKMGFQLPEELGG